MTQYTPGPWTAGGILSSEDATLLGDEVWVTPGPGESGPIAICHGLGNATLIAAAPDLLTACQQLENALAFALMGKPLENTQTLIASAQAVITKAGGWIDD